MVMVTSPRKRKEQEQTKVVFRTTVAASVVLSVLALFVIFTDNEKRPARIRQLPGALNRARLRAIKWPALEETYNGREVIADPQYLLDFAIIGFEKSGSSTFMKWLGSHPQVQCFQEEIYDLYRNRTGTMVWRLDTELEHGYQYKRGYKSPVDIYNVIPIQLLDEVFPKTRLILTLRHPVLWVSVLW